MLLLLMLFTQNTPLLSQYSHAALTQRVAVNLAFQKHRFKLNEGPDGALYLDMEEITYIRTK